MSQSAALTLPEVDEVRVTVIVDNAFDMLLGHTDVATRFPLAKDVFDHPLPTAEHGFSCLIEVRAGDRSGTVLFDTGVSGRGLLWNIDAIGVDPQDFRAIVLSHGHADHALGLPGLVERLGKRSVPLILHPDAYLERRLLLPNGDEVGLPAPRIADIRREGVEVLEEPGPSFLVDNMLLVSGEVARTTDFEKGFPIHQALRDGQWTPDPLIHDDQCAVANVRGRGLVVITGCGHAGIVNTVRYAKALTGVDRVYAVIGGFHLSGAAFEPIIPATVAALKDLAPVHLLPGHCTGWRATHAIAREMPDAFVPNSVGTVLTLAAGE